MIVKDNLSLDKYKQAFKKVLWQNTFLEKQAENSFAQFLEIGLPVSSDEEWKYVQIEKLFNNNFSLLSNFDATENTEFTDEWKLEECSNFKIKNNTILNKHTELQNKVCVSSLKEVWKEYGEIIEKYFNKDQQLNSFKLLNSSFSNDAIFVYLGKDVVLDKPLNLVFEANAQNINYARLFVFADKFTKGEIVINFYGNGEYFTNYACEIILQEGSQLRVSYVQDESHQATHIANTLINLEQNTELCFYNFTLGSNLSKHRIEANLNGEGANCALNGLYVLSDDNQAHNQIVLNHHKPNCSSTQLYKGILDDSARAEFSGTINVAKYAIKTDAKQLNRNLLISPKAKVDTRPQLQIEADDVKCAHGASIGQLEEEQMFYLLSRGISKESAKNLLVYGFAEEVVEKIHIASLRKKLDRLFIANIHN